MPSRFRSPSGRYILWAELVAEARRRPGKRQLLLPDEPVRLATTIRQRSHPDLHLSDGRLEVEVTAAAVDELGVRRGNLYVRYIQNVPVNQEKE
jgi:hypothetical protein